MADRRLTAPTPMMALVLVWVVDTGMPSRLEYSRQSAPARSAQKPWYRSSLTMSMPTDLMIFSPPTLVPRAMTTLHSSISQTGISMPATEPWPWAKASPRNSTPMNFWPSWAPCMKLMPAAPAIWATRKKRLAARSSMLRHRMVASLQMIQPVAKPSSRLRARPYSTLTHSLKLMPPTPPWMAMAAPDRPAIRLWLSLVGMPKTDAPTL